jgi:hypothetical protein
MAMSKINKVLNLKVKHSHYRPMGSREFWEMKDSGFRDIGT